MGFEAVEALDRATDETKKSLEPFDFVLWTKLALVVILAGLGTSTLGNMADVFEFLDMGAQGGLSLGVLAVAGFISLTISIVFLYVRSLFTFVFYESLISKEVTLIEYMRDFSRTSLGYFGFLVSVFVLTIALTLPAVLVTYNSYLMMVGVLLGGLFLLAVYVLNIFARDLVVPRMIDKELGFVEAFKEVYSVVREQLADFGVYVVITTVLSLIFAIVVGIAALSMALVLLLVASPVLIVSYLISPFLLILPILLLLVLWIYLILLVRVPFYTYLFDYALNYYEGILDSEIYE